MAQRDNDERPDARAAAAPRAWRLAGLVALGIVLLGAGLLIWLRGEAIVVDLASLGSRIFCF